MRSRPAGACVATTATVETNLDALLFQGCQIKSGGIDDGCLIVLDGDARVYQALQKCEGGMWIVMVFNTERVTWNAMEDDTDATLPGEV